MRRSGGLGEVAEVTERTTREGRGKGMDQRRGEEEAADGASATDSSRSAMTPHGQRLRGSRDQWRMCLPPLRKDSAGWTGRS